MKESVARFVQELANLSPSLGAAHQETINYWAPDEPPVTIVLAELGRRVVDDFDMVNTDTNERIFRIIEVALVKGDEELSTAVATGMIEAIVGRAIRGGIWDRVQRMLGEKSASHAAAWASF